ncbi:UNVERIFIED_ORG: hypothetical protein M2355_003129 [Lelliottia amnigena]|nr:hypothetical protein [Lelliottia amnigena]
MEKRIAIRKRDDFGIISAFMPGPRFEVSFPPFLCVTVDVKNDFHQTPLWAIKA